MKKINEHYGCLTKVEDLWCIEEAGIPNTCILESREIFPGYYSSPAGSSKPKHVFIMSKQDLTLEKVARLSAAVKKDYSKPFDAAFCEITIANQVCSGIRISGMEDYSGIKELQALFADHGTDLKKKVSNINKTEAIIKVRKFFNLEKASQFTYLDNVQNNMGYFVVDSDIPWEEFKQNILKLKNNWHGNSFDAAKCFIYENANIKDLVRIYSHDINDEFINTIREAYVKVSTY